MRKKGVRLMNRYHDNFHDDFSHTRTEIGSRNRVHLRDLHMGAFAPVAMVVGVFTLAVFVLVAGYFVITQWPLVKTFLLICFYVFAALCAGGVLLLAWAGVNQFRRIHAKTKAIVTYYDAQDLRNHVIETAGGPVLHDPIGRFRAALPPKEILKERYYGSNALPSPAAMDEEGDEPDHGLLEALQERRPVRDYEAHA